MKIKFIPQNIEVDGVPEKTLLQIATENKILIKSFCKGAATCAECRIRIVEGEGFVTPPTKAELNVIGTSYYIDSRRLACQVRCFGPVVVDMTEQLNQENLKNKKIRGFRSTKQVESSAVQDTLLLKEGPPEKFVDSPVEQVGERTGEKVNRGRQPNQGGNQGGNQSGNQGRHRGPRRGQGSGSNQNKNQGQGKGRNSNPSQGQNKGQRPGQGQGQKGPHRGGGKPG